MVENSLHLFSKTIGISALVGLSPPVPQKLISTTLLMDSKSKGDFKRSLLNLNGLKARMIPKPRPIAQDM